MFIAADFDLSAVEDLSAVADDLSVYVFKPVLSLY